MFYIIFILVLILVCIVLRLYPFFSRFLKTSSVINRIPGPKTFPLLGNLLQTINLRKDERLKFVVDTSSRYGPICRLWAGPMIPVIIISNAELAQVILSSTIHVNKGIVYKFLEPWLGTGLLTASKEKWSVWRKLLTPAFHFSNLETFLDVFNRNALTLVEELETRADGQELDLYPYLYNCALDTICESTMGVKINAQKGKGSKYIDNVHRVTECLMKRALNFLYYFDPIYKLTNFYKTERESLEVLHHISSNVICERMRERMILKDKNSSKSEKEKVLEEKKRTAFLDILLDISDKGERQFSIVDMREQVDTFMFAGHDTTSIALAWTIYFVGRNPEVQEKIFDELDPVFGSSNRPANLNDMNNLKYLECVFKESIRLFPPVPVLSRVIEKDITIGGYEVPAGTFSFINVFGLHHSPEHYSNPDKFDPGHFFIDEVKTRHPFSYIPFSAGPRNCIGQKYAMLKEKTILSTFFRKYRVESVQNEDDMTTNFELVLRPARGPIIKIEKRK